MELHGVLKRAHRDTCVVAEVAEHRVVVAGLLGEPLARDATPQVPVRDYLALIDCGIGGGHHALDVT